MDTLPDTRGAPVPEIAIDTVPVREIIRHEPPLNPADVDIQHGVDDLAHIQFSMSPTRLFWRDEIFDHVPLLVSEIGLVWNSVHHSNHFFSFCGLSKKFQ